jgi:opacity protein-like surface antigen
MSAVARLTCLTLLATLLGGVATANAADLLPPIPTLDRADEVVEIGTGWYLRGDIGYVDYARVRDVPFGPAGTAGLDEERLDNTFSLGGGIGYQLTSWLRADATIDHRFGSGFTGTRPNPTYGVGMFRDRAELESTTFLVNGYVDFGYWSGITPYVGAGIGVSANRLTNVVRETYVGDVLQDSVQVARFTGTQLAWALMAGVAVDVGSGFTLDLGYRYINLGEARTRLEDTQPGIRTKDIEAHEFRLGARYVID